MSFKPGYGARILLGELSYSAKLNQVSLANPTEMHDVTTFGDSDPVTGLCPKRFIAGQDSATSQISGFLDADVLTDAAAFTTATPLTIGLEGLAHSAPVFLVDALRANMDTSAQTSGVVQFTLDAQADGFPGIGNSLHNLSAETIDGNGTSHDGTAASATGAVAHVHVTAFSGLTSVDFTIEDSANNSAFAVIGTFSQLTAIGAQRIAISGAIRRYVRIVTNVTGTGSVTFAAAYART